MPQGLHRPPWLRQAGQHGPRPPRPRSRSPTTTARRRPPTSRCGSRRWSRCWSRRGWSIRPRWTPSSTTSRPRSARATAPAWWREPGPIRPIATRLLADATAAIAELGYTGGQGEHMVAVENTPTIHNLVVCTLCSCYPWPVLGLPPVWYKSPAYRSRAVIDPRGVLAEFGTELGDRRRSAGLGFHRRGPLPGDPRAAGRDRGPGRGGAGRAGHPRRHDRHGACCERRPRHGRHARPRPGRAGAGRAGLPPRLGAARPRAGDRLADPRQHRRRPPPARADPRPRLPAHDLLREVVRGAVRDAGEGRRGDRRGAGQRPRRSRRAEGDAAARAWRGRRRR